MSFFGGSHKLKDRLLSLILTLAIISGQIIKLPLGGFSSGTLLDLTLGMLCLYGLFKMRFRLPNPPLFIKLALGFVAAGTISLIVTPLNLSLNEVIISLFYNLRLFVYILFGWMLFAKAFPQINSQIYSIFLYSAFILASLGLMQLIFLPDIMFLSIYGWDPHYFRTVSTFLDPNFLGAFLTVNLLLLAAYLFAKSRTDFPKLKNVRVLAMFLIIYLAILATFSRGTILTLAISFSTISLMLKSSRLFILTITLVLFFFISFYLYTQVVSTPRNIDREASAANRLGTWQEGIEVFKFFPISGIGFNSYRFALEDLNLAPSELINSRGGASNDSSLLFVLATTGLIGFLIYISFLSSLLFTGYKAFKKGNIFGAIYISGFLGLVANSFFNNSLFYPFILFWMIAFAAKLKTTT